MDVEMSDIFSGLIAFGLMFFLVFVIYVIMKRDDDVGEIATKKIGNQSLFLLEILLVVANGAEMLSAASVASTTSLFEVSYAGRLVLHAVLALTSVLGGFSFSKQLKEAFKYWNRPVQWIQVLFSLILVIIGPLGNLAIMAYSMNQIGALLGWQMRPTGEFYTDGTPIKVLIDVGIWQNVLDGMLDPVLFATAVVTAIHCFLVIVISTIAYDKVYSLHKEEDKKDKKEEDKKDKKEDNKEEKKDDDKEEKKEKKDKIDKVDYVPEALDLMAKGLGNTIKAHEIMRLVNDAKDTENKQNWIVNTATEYQIELAKLKEANKSGNAATIEKAEGYVSKREQKFKQILAELNK